MNNTMKKVLGVLIASVIIIGLIAAIGGCSEENDPHKYCNCDEKIEELETENSKLDERVSSLESQLADMTTTTTTATTTTADTTEVQESTATTTTTTTVTTKAQGGGGNKTTKATTTKATTAATTKPTTAPTTKPTTAATTKPTSGDGFGTDVGM